MAKLMNTFVMMLAYSNLNNNEAGVTANCEIYNDLKKTLNV